MAKILVIMVFIISLIALILFYLIPLFQNKSLTSIFQESLVHPIGPSPELISSTPTLIIDHPQVSPTQTIPQNSPTPILTSTPTPTPTLIPVNDDTSPWGVAQKIGEHTWTIKIGQDPVMATPSEILEALNNYRSLHGSQKLTLDSKLTEYAQQRAVYFYQKKGLDAHQGFNNFLTNEDGFGKLGFTWLGENASYGYRLNGVHLIEWIYASDEEHNQNQLNNNWNFVGIGVQETANCLIFGTGKS